MASSELLGAKALRDVLERHGVRPSKSLGQNFVHDPNTIRKVVSVAGVGPGDHVLEIGPGAGSLTLGLAAAAGRVSAVEVDASLLPVLGDTLTGRANVEVLHGDALTFDLGGIGASAVVANLPYNVAVPIVMRVLETAPSVASLTVMTQREVGERLAAAPGTKAYGQPSVLVAYFASARVAATVARRAFWPVPNVDSVLVRIERRDPPPVAYPDLRAVVRAAFAQRRKTLRNSLSALLGPGAEEAIRAVGVDPDARPERLDLQAFVSLARLAAPGVG